MKSVISFKEEGFMERWYLKFDLEFAFVANDEEDWKADLNGKGNVMIVYKECNAS